VGQTFPTLRVFFILGPHFEIFCGPIICDTTTFFIVIIFLSPLWQLVAMKASFLGYPQEYIIFAPNLKKGSKDYLGNEFVRTVAAEHADTVPTLIIGLQG
jgi:hypothetical protein